MRARATETDRRIVGLAIPALGTLAAEPLYRIVDTAIVGRLGTDQLAGLAVAITLLALVVAGSNFLTYGTTQRVANRLGARRPAEAADVGVQAMWLAGIVSTVAVPVLVFGARPLAGAIGAEGAVLEFAVEYLRIAAVGVPFVLIALAAQGIQRGASDYRTPLVILVASNIANLVIELVLVFGFDLGIAGAAWSTAIAQAGAGIAFLVVVRRHLEPAGHRRPRWSEMAPLLTAGRHLLLRVGSMLAVFTGATAIAARIDASTLAAHQVAMTMFLFLALVLDALAVPAQTLVAEELGHGGSGAADIARRVLRLSLVAAVAIALVVAVTSPLLPTCSPTIPPSSAGRPRHCCSWRCWCFPVPSPSPTTASSSVRATTGSWASPRSAISWPWRRSPLRCWRHPHSGSQGSGAVSSPG
jgi:putative MATE family efflux protein